MIKDRELILSKAPNNTTAADRWCIWCQAEIGEVHSPARPNGKRYWYFQDVGGVPVERMNKETIAGYTLLDMNDI